jgi:hypothetical protein
MHQESTRIRLTIAELKALRAFSVTESKAKKLAVNTPIARTWAGAVLRISDNEIRASATDGKSCVLATTDGVFSLGTHRWWIPRAELDVMINVLKARGSVADLEIGDSDALVTYVVFREVKDEEGEVSLEEQQTVAFTEPVEEDGQLGFPESMIGEFVVPNEAPVEILSSPFDPRLVARSILIADATGTVRYHSPAKHEEPLVLTAGCVEATEWKAAIKPLRETVEARPVEEGSSEPLALEPTGSLRAQANAEKAAKRAGKKGKRGK